MQSAWPDWTWADLASNIPQKPGFAKCPAGTYAPPQGFSGPVPYDFAEIQQHHYLQVAMQDLDERFGWHGLNNQYNPLVLVQNVDPQLSCTTHAAPKKLHFGIISCGLDYDAVVAGLPQRVPPIEVFAHEFGHTIINDLGYTSAQDFDEKVVVEALADMFAVAAKSAHGGDPWLVGDRPAMMERFKEWYCASAGGGEYCDLPPLAAVRDLANPKTMNPIDPGADFYAGDNWMKAFSITGKWNYHGSSQVVSGMLRRVAVGAAAGARDGKPPLGTYPAFAGIGLQETLEIFWDSLSGLALLNNSALPLDDYAAQFRLAAVRQCGEWSEADLAARKSAWIANMSSFDVDLTEAGYIDPPWDAQTDIALVDFSFKGEASQAYQFQVATNNDFLSVAHENTVTTDVAGVGSFTLKLAAEKPHWWRVRLANAPMLASGWVNQDEACWRPAAAFTTGAPLKVINPYPMGVTAATGDEVEPWNVEFRWTGSNKFAGYEFFVDDEEPEGGKYSKVWARKPFEGKDLPVDPENPGTVEAPNFRAPPIPLPKSRHLCWKIIPFLRDDQGKRIDGDATEQCFRTREPETLITHPAPPAADGTLSHAPAQPLAIDYNPADGAAHHEFSLQLLELAGNDAPSAEDQWAYEDDVQSDPANKVVESANPSDWDTRTRLRMLPVQLDASPYINYSLGKVRITIKSRSPVISSKELNGGTYPEFRESAQPAVRDFHPSDPANFTALHPYITAPPSAGTCSSSTSPDLFVEWKHGSEATPEVIEKYRVALYPERCASGPAGCRTIADHDSDDFVDSLAHATNVKHNGKTLQRIEFDRQVLFPDEASEMNDVTGFLAHLYGVSGPEPGPANLNITGTTLVHLPVVPAQIVANVFFEDGGEGNPQDSQFQIFAQTSKSPTGFVRAGQYSPPDHDVMLYVYRGATCDENEFVGEAENHVTFDFDELGMADDPNPVVSAWAGLVYPTDMKCPQTASKCVARTGTNRLSKPKPASGLTPRETGGHLGASWDISTDANPETLEYFVGIAAQGNDSANQLVNHPATVMLTNSELQSIDDQIGTHSLAVLDPADIGKNVILRVLVCRAGTNRCSEEVSVPHTIGSAAAGGVPPSVPLDVALHFEDGSGLSVLTGDDSFDAFQSGWITVSWNAPPGGTPPSHYLVTFSASGDVPGMLPNWLNTLGLASVNYPADPLQYTAVIRALPEGLVVTNTTWGDFVWPLAETHVSVPPTAGTWVTAKVWACSGPTPLSALQAHGWILGANLDACSAPSEMSAQVP